MTHFRLPVLVVIALSLAVSACGRKGFLEEPQPAPGYEADGTPKEDPPPVPRRQKPLMENKDFPLDKLL